MMLLAMPCWNLWVYVFISMLYGQILVFTCLYAWICVLPCLYAYILMLRCTFTCLHAYFHAYMCRSVLLHAQIDVLFMLYAIIYVLVCFTHVYVVKPRPCLSCHVLLQPFCSFYHIFLCFGLMVRTRSRPYVLCQIGRAHV